MKKVLTFLTAIFMFSGISAQEPGDLDITYGVDGIGTHSWTNLSVAVSSIGLQSDGSIITAGYIQNTSTFDYNGFVSRLDKDGFENSFGNNISFFQYNFDETESVMATCVLPNNEIINAGYYGTGNTFVSRLGEDGSFDAFFGNAGFYQNESVSFVPTDIDVYDTPQGYNIVMSGYSNDYHPMILVLDQDGDAVTTFGTDGYYEFTGTTGIMTKLVIDTEEEVIYTCGTNILGFDAFISKHNLNDGSLVTSFNSNGYVLLEPFGDAIQFSARGLAFNSVGEDIAVFGDFYHSAGDIDMYAVRLNASDGSFDNSFGLNGWSTLRIPVYDEVIYAATQQADGKYYFGGVTTINGTNDFMLGRTNTNGSMDFSFGENGFAITDLGEDENVADIILSEDQNRIFAGGNMDISSQYEIKVACYHTGFTVGIPDAEIHHMDMNVYPNPTQDIIHIETAIAGSYSVSVSDPAGKLYVNKELSGSHLMLDLSTLPAGIFIIKLTNKSNRSFYSKVVKR